jgi:hypothetical protein
MENSMRSAWKHTPEQAAIVKQVRELSDKASKSEQRICFGLIWFAEESDAVELGRLHREGTALGLHYTVNGGMYDGMVCRRAPEFDTVNEDGIKLYACRT